MLYKEPKKECSQENFRITKENIDSFFDELGKGLRKIYKKQHIELILVGGASILVNYGFRGMTTDIDALLCGAYSIKDEVNKIGDKYDLPEGWLNADFVKTQSYSPKLVSVSKYYKTFAGVLEVRTIADEYLIAMKLMSSREYKNDKSDIVGILATLEKMGKEMTMEKICNAVNILYGDISVIPRKSMEFLEKVMENKAYVSLYDDIKNEEEQNKAALVKFEAEYPNALKEDNLDEILDKISKSKGCL